MFYQVLARKWRPQKFIDILGQSHITLTLQNAIKKNRVAHAYLFVGPRGIGKTTTARILAKALNCPSPQTMDNEFIEPCCQCDTCKEISSGNCLDVIEIDGASHNKVDDIRELRDHVLYTPTHGRNYKIFIIDEVHMLSTAAWNALLKTLEEPPAHIKFLFATTEAHKVLPTIVSRCQRFDLKRIPVSIIVTHLRKIALSEGVRIEESALELIARAADGGMRDSQSILDQILAFGGSQSLNSTPDLISEADVINVFGLTSPSQVKDLAMAMIKNQAHDIIELIHHLADNGRSLEYLYSDLLMVFRNLIIIKYVHSPQSILEISHSDYRDFNSMSDICPANLLVKLAEGLMTYEGEIRSYLNKRLFIELTLLRVMRDSHSHSLDNVLSTLKNIDCKLVESANESSVVIDKIKPKDVEKTFSNQHNSVTTQNHEIRPPNASSIHDELLSELKTANKDHLSTPIYSTDQREVYQERGNFASVYDNNAIPLSNNMVNDDQLTYETTNHDENNEAIRIWHLLTEEIGKLPGRTTLQFHMREAVPLSYRNGLLKVGMSDDFPSEHGTEMTGFDINQTLKRCLARICPDQDTEINFVKVSENFSLKTKTAIYRTLTANSSVWKKVKNNQFVKDICHLFNGEIVDVRG